MDEVNATSVSLKTFKTNKIHKWYSRIFYKPLIWKKIVNRYKLSKYYWHVHIFKNWILNVDMKPKDSLSLFSTENKNYSEHQIQINFLIPIKLWLLWIPYRVQLITEYVIYFNDTRFNQFNLFLNRQFLISTCPH